MKLKEKWPKEISRSDVNHSLGRRKKEIGKQMGKRRSLSETDSCVYFVAADIGKWKNFDLTSFSS
jgi:hypothetical protein